MKTLALLLAVMASAQSPIPQDALIIHIDRDGSLRLNQDRIEFSPLVDRLQQIPKATRTTVFIVAAGDTAFKDVARVADAAKSSGFEHVGIVKASEEEAITPSSPPVGAIVLNVDRAGVIRLDGRKVKLSGISSQLQRTFKRRADRTVVVQAYGLAPFETVSAVIDAARASGASKVGLMTSEE